VPRAGGDADGAAADALSAGAAATAASPDFAASPAVAPLRGDCDVSSREVATPPMVYEPLQLG